MKQWLLVAFLCVFALGCGQTYTYKYYEVIHSPDQLKVGDVVDLVTEDGVSIQGTLTRINQDDLVVTTEKTGTRHVPWKDIRVLQRVAKAKVTDE